MSSDNQTTPSSSTRSSPPASVGTSQVRPRRFYMLRAFIYRLLPLMLFTISLITGTVILIYAVVNKRVLPPKFIIGSFITIGIIVVVWCLLKTILFLRQEFGTQGVDEAEAKMNRLDHDQLAGKQGWSKKCWRWFKETSVLIGKMGTRSDGTRSPVLGRNGAEARCSPRSPPAGGVQDSKLVGEVAQPRTFVHAIQGSQISPLQLAVRSSPPKVPGTLQQNQNDPRRKPTLQPSRGTKKSLGPTVNNTRLRSRDKLTTAHPSPPHASQPVVYIEQEPQKMESKTRGPAHRPIPTRQHVTSTDTPQWHTPQQTFNRPTYYPRPASALPPSLSIESILAHPQVHAQGIQRDHDPSRQHPPSRTSNPLSDSSNGDKHSFPKNASPQSKAPHQTKVPTTPSLSPSTDPSHQKPNEVPNQDEPQSQSQSQLQHEKQRYSAYNPPPCQIIPEITSASSRRHTVAYFSGPPSGSRRLESMELEIKMDDDGYYRHGLYD
ncbi:hypothetical protein DID88_009643 [Monilinia fructigena]|uniref:Uncharacterized protein n=1 Tax=Monilinia fructigena TaxID=38457 RepID=A0A395IMT2_9HELO|nr:hypothetical protein DID88_009643 [Monilinia fructigena]